MSSDDPMVAAIERLASAVRSIAHGGLTGPEGIEGLTMAIADISPSSRESLSRSVQSVANELSRLADAHERIADSVEHAWRPKVDDR